MGVYNFSKEFNENTFNNLKQIYFEPEILERKKRGLLDDDFVLHHGQALIFAHNRETIIRLNDEVVAQVKVKEGIDYTQPNFSPNCDEVERIEIAEDEFLNCAHVTMITFNDGCLLKFDFAYNKKFCKELINNASQFLSTSKFALEKNYINAAIDNAFSSFELLAKANLLMEANNKITFDTNHKGIQANFNLRYKNATHEAEKNLRDWFNKLTNERRNARYLDNNVLLTKDDLTKAHNRIDEFLEELSKRLQFKN